MFLLQNGLLGPHYYCMPISTSLHGLLVLTLWLLGRSQAPGQDLYRSVSDIKAPALQLPKGWYSHIAYVPCAFSLLS